MLTGKQFLESLKYVVSKSNFVRINNQAIDKYTRNFSLARITHWSKIYPLGYKRRKSDDDELDFLFLIGSLAFCFWGYPKKWTVNFKGKKLDGWWALIACCERALENRIPLLEGEYLSKLSLDSTRKIFAGEPEIPLLEKRKKILNETGETLVKKYGGRFHNFYQKQTREAFNLIEKITDEFYGFDDAAWYRNSHYDTAQYHSTGGTKVLFYKKAQVVLTDIHEIFKGREYGAITNIEKLPGHADYKIPAVLRKLGILEYNTKLRKIVDNRIQIPEGSGMEVEIRANTLWAIHLILEEIKVKYPDTTSVLLSGILWTQSQNNFLDKPYHLSKTIFY